MRWEKLPVSALIFCLIIGFGCFWAGPGIADDEHEGGRNFERKDHHESRHGETGDYGEDEKGDEGERERDDEGSESAGQIAAWLLLLANLPVAISVLIKSANRLMPEVAAIKGSLANFNRLQKKRLMFLHYYLNPVIFCVAIFHYLSSRCTSTALPELGLFLMVGIMALGIMIRFKLCPKAFRKSVYRIHTQPLILVAMILVLTIGHGIVD